MRSTFVGKDVSNVTVVSTHHVKPKRHNGRIGWKARAIQAQQDLREYRDEIRMKMWVCWGIGVACGAVGVTGAFFVMTVLN